MSEKEISFFLGALFMWCLWILSGFLEKVAKSYREQRDFEAEVQEMLDEEDNEQP